METPTKVMADTQQCDRFIPSRSALDVDMANYALTKENGAEVADRATTDVVSPAKVRALGTRGRACSAARARPRARALTEARERRNPNAPS